MSLKILEGKVIELNDDTGHYRPNRKELNSGADILKQMGVAIPDIKITQKHE